MTDLRKALERRRDDLSAKRQLSRAMFSGVDLFEHETFCAGFDAAVALLLPCVEKAMGTPDAEHGDLREAIENLWSELDEKYRRE